VASITDALGNVTRMAYDGLGRRTQLIRPDAGTTRYEYDAASNLVALRTANLLARGEAIRYDYEFTRLSAVHYPAVPERDLGSGFHGRTLPAEDITYTYGGPGAAANAAGRLVRITDPSGFEERAYGRLGEVVRQTRRIEGLERGGRAQTFTTQYRYDTWGRLLGITYPAGEVLSYEYDAGGRVSRVTGRDRGQTFEYLRRLEYDKFQQQAYVELGNGVSTTASYRPEDQRLDRLQSASAAGEFQDLRFAYDPVGNVRSIINDVAVPPRTVIGGPTEQHFEYDELYRLTGATGVRVLAHDKRDEYALSLRYDAIHNLLEKRQRHDIVEPSGQRVRQGATSDDFNYRYSSNQPHAAIEVGGRGFTFDANGNQTSATQAQPGSRRSVVWDDEDRVRSVFMNGRETRFAYDASGTRLLKSGHGDEVAYFNQFFTVRNGEQVTQHVYVGDKRLASRLIGPRPGNSKKGPDPDDLYFLHTDPLGSTQFVTNAAGDVTEHLEYFPFGEIWTDDSKRGAVSDLKFSGRELDENTGLYYFGVRYQDPELGQFLSVNPASASEGRQLVTSGSAPLSVYAFANDNPIRLQNASGLAPSWWSQLGQTAALFEGAGGQAVGGSRAPPAGSGVFDDTDSPVLAGAASEFGDFTAGEGVGAFDASSPGKSAVAARFNRKYADMWGGGRPRSNAVVGERPVVERQRSNAVVGKAPELGRKRSNAVVGGGLQHDENGQAPIILGENMDGRVTPFARSVGGETIVDWLDGREWSQQLNDDFVEWVKAEGRTVIDIGPDYARRLQRSLNPSSGAGFNCVYCGEAKQLGGYTKVRQVFQRLGEFQGGVPGFEVYGPPGGRPNGMQQ
jgi:RHS repeat-associated protein